MRERKTGREGGLTITEKGRMVEEKRERLRTGAGGVKNAKEAVTGGRDKRVSPERREIKGCPLKGFAPAGWGTPSQRRQRPRVREEG